MPIISVIFALPDWAKPANGTALVGNSSHFYKILDTSFPIWRNRLFSLFNNVAKLESITELRTRNIGNVGGACPIKKLFSRDAIDIAYIESSDKTIEKQKKCEKEDVQTCH